MKNDRYGIRRRAWLLGLGSVLLGTALFLSAVPAQDQESQLTPGVL
jgi:hypothetical protein